MRPYYQYPQQIPMSIVVNPSKLQNINEILSCSLGRGALYIGDFISLKKPELILRNSIQAVVSCAHQASFTPNISCSIPIQNYKNLQARDSLYQNLIQHFDKAYQFIESHLQANKNVLVYCHAGVSRSATIVIAFLIKKFNWTFQKAEKWVKQRRPRIKPNENFRKQLKQYQNIQLFNNYQKKIQSQTKIKQDQQKTYFLTPTKLKAKQSEDKKIYYSNHLRNHHRDQNNINFKSFGNLDTDQLNPQNLTRSYHFGGQKRTQKKLFDHNRFFGSSQDLSRQVNTNLFFSKQY